MAPIVQESRSMEHEKQYRINEVFVAKQGEGLRSGEMSIFVRFSGCNMRCDLEASQVSPGGFKCDTEFTSGRSLNAAAILKYIDEMKAIAKTPECNWIVLTGGEPMLQVDQPLIDALHQAGYRLQIETNGTLEVPRTIDFITVSPKVAEHAIVQRSATEVKYVRGYGQALPSTCVDAKHFWISAAFDSGSVAPKTVEWCSQLCEGTKWKLSLQTHNLEGSR